MRGLIYRWRLRRARRAFDWLVEQGEPAEVVTPPGGIRRVRIGSSPDWISDDGLSYEEKLTRFEALHPEWTRGPSRFVLTTHPPTLTVGGTSTWTFQ